MARFRMLRSGEPMRDVPFSGDAAMSSAQAGHRQGPRVLGFIAFRV